jgi:deoxycytidylate deaminase
MGAVLVKGSRILAVGHNQLRPSKIIGTTTLHAEAAAILKLLKEGRQHDLVNASLYVSRYTRGGRIGLARPCASCMSLIRSVGIQEISYTTNEGNTMMEKV